jgi:hypothetical protein
LDIDEKLESRGELHGQVSRLRAFQDSVNVVGRAVEAPVQIDPVTYKPTCLDMLAISIDGRQFLRRRSFRYLDKEFRLGPSFARGGPRQIFSLFKGQVA